MNWRPFTLPATLPVTRIFCDYPTRTLPEVKKPYPSQPGQDGAELAATALHSRLAKYDSNFRPGYGGDPLEVAVRVRQLAVGESGEVSIQLGVAWQDLRLAHEVEGVEEIRFSLNSPGACFLGFFRLFGDRALEIWQPELVIGAGLQGVSSLLLRFNLYYKFNIGSNQLESRPNGGVELTQ